MLDNCEHLVDACAAPGRGAAARLPRPARPGDQPRAAGASPARRPGACPRWRCPTGAPAGRRRRRWPRVRGGAALRRARRAPRGPASPSPTANAAAVAAGLPRGWTASRWRSSWRRRGVRALPVEQIAARLDDRFRLLTGGSRTALPRQQTLRATHRLEPRPADRAGAGAAAAGWPSSPAAGRWRRPRRSCAGEGVAAREVLDLLARLVDKSLVQAEAERGGEARYRLLETVRQYAAERLAEAGEAAAARDRHAAWCLALAERAEPALRGPASRRAWLARLEAEHDNLRAALAWCLDARPGGRRCGWPAACAPFWRVRGITSRRAGAGWSALLARAPAPTGRRARALLGGGVLAYARRATGAGARLARGEPGPEPAAGRPRPRRRRWRDRARLLLFWLGDYRPARALLEEARRAGARESATGAAWALALCYLGRLADWRGRLPAGAGAARGEPGAVRARSATAWRWPCRPSGWAWWRWPGATRRGRRRWLEEALALARAVGAPLARRRGAERLGPVASGGATSPGARGASRRGLAAARDGGRTARHRLGAGRRWGGGAGAGRRGAGAGAAGGEPGALRRRWADLPGRATALHGLGLAAWRQGDASGRRRLPAGEPGAAAGAGRAGWASPSAWRGWRRSRPGPAQPARAARLLGAAEALRAAIGAPLPPVERPDHDEATRRRRGRRWARRPSRRPGRRGGR